MASRVTDCVQGYTVLASSVLEQWSALAKKSASTMDAGGYTAASALEDATAGALLTAQAGLASTALWWECLAGRDGFEGEATTNRSRKFRVPPGAKVELLRTFVTGPGLEQLPAGAVTIHPKELKSADEEFTLRADGIVCRGATYVSEVNVTFGQVSTPMWVWITIT